MTGYLLSNAIAMAFTVAATLVLTNRDRVETALAIYWTYATAAVDKARPNLRGVASELGSDWRAKFEDRKPRHREPVSRWAAVRVRKVRGSEVAA